MHNRRLKEPQPKWVSDSFLADYFQVHRTTIWRWSKTGRLPAPVEIGENTTRWDFDAVRATENSEAK